MAITYKKAGVDIEAANQLVGTIKKINKGKTNRGVVGSIGGFSGFFDPSFLGFKKPYLVASTDGVGTKLHLANLQKKHDTIGIDLVAMCVNDLICTGATPLFFLDYFACGKLDNQIAAKVIKGISKGCEESSCALIGGETAEMPGFYEGKKYDLAGFSVGMADAAKVIDGSKIRKGDVLIGLASSGFHSNGYSLLRKLFKQNELAGAWGKKLLTPTRIYVKPILDLIKKVPVKGIAHITGGAYYDKLPRIVPKGLCARVNTKAWPIPPIFKEAQKRAKINDREMYTTFNMGIGMIVAVAKKDVAKTQAALSKYKFKNYVIGEFVKSAGEAVELI